MGPKPLADSELADRNNQLQKLARTHRKRFRVEIGPSQKLHAELNIGVRPPGREASLAVSRNRTQTLERGRSGGIDRDLVEVLIPDENFDLVVLEADLLSKRVPHCPTATGEEQSQEESRG